MSPTHRPKKLPSPQQASPKDPIKGQSCSATLWPKNLPAKKRPKSSKGQKAILALFSFPKRPRPLENLFASADHQGVMSYNRRWLKTLAKAQFAQPPPSPSPVFPTISKQGPSFSISQLGWRPQSEVPSLFMQMSSDFDGVITNIFGKLLLWMRNIPG